MAAGPFAPVAPFKADTARRESIAGRNDSDAVYHGHGSDIGKKIPGSIDSSDKLTVQQASHTMAILRVPHEGTEMR